MKVKLFFIFVLTLPFNAISQDEKEFEHKKIISIVPQYIFKDGFRFDFEYALKKNRKSWLQVSPTLFLSIDDGDFSNTSYNSMNGIAFEVHHKYFIKEPDERRGFYFAYGGGFQLLVIKTDQLIDYTYVENGNEYISFKEDEVTVNINRFLFNVVVGKQIVRSRPFIIDYYMGVGFRYSVDKNFNMIEDYNDGWFDHGYSGSLLVAGLKFGFNF